VVGSDHTGEPSFEALPANLPVPEDDDAAAHLEGIQMPAIALPATTGGDVFVDRAPAGFERLILYFYPKTGVPGVPMPEGWDEIPGARGCTPEACAFRDHAAELAEAGAAVAGVSTQSTEYQREAAERLELTFPLLSDIELRLTNALGLPTFEAAGEVLIKRLTLVIRNGFVEKVFYPVFPPDEHADQVLAYLRDRVR
jgi:peroxiredoxin